MIKMIINYIKKMTMSKEDYVIYLKKNGVRIGEGCDINKTANFGSEPWLIKIGNNVRITQRVQFITHDGGLWTLRKMGLIDNEAVKYGNIEIADNCNISWDVTIMPNVRIGKNCIIACGAVVTKDIPDNEIWGGVPAKRIESIEEYYSKIKDKVVFTNSKTNEEKQEILRSVYPEWFQDK